MEKLVPYKADTTPLACLFHDLPGFAWVSCLQDGKRLEIISALPQASLISSGSNLAASASPKAAHQETKNHTDSPIEWMNQQINSHKGQDSSFDFNCGLIGYLAYEARNRELLPPLDRRQRNHFEIPLPEIQVGLYDWALVINHDKQQSALFFQDHCPEVTRKQVEERLSLGADSRITEDFHLTAPFTSDQPAEQYQKNFRRIQDYIRAGDCYQVNYSQRFSSGYQGDPWQAYVALRKNINPPFSAFIRTPQGAILSLSPEQFIQVQENRITTAPIKGTRPRGATSSEDQELLTELACSTKDRAENLMIVDLLRNDLSLHAVTGSVQVDKLFEIQSFHNVHHMVSTVSARKKPDVSPLQVFWDAFPGGSITGAPKRRAMEIIEELEPHSRSAYCGSIFWCSYSGNLNSNIAIRTLVCENGRIYCWGGGGIVADSDEEQEYQESVNKVRYFMEMLEREFLSAENKA